MRHKLVQVNRSKSGAEGMFLSRFFKKAPDDAIAHQLYVIIAAQSRLPEFYRGGAVPDSLDGRFDMLALHMFLVLQRLSVNHGADPHGTAQAELAQQLFDVMFGDMDRSLREMGVGDLTVGKRIRAMTEAFYGRVEAYAAGLAATGDGQATLMDALQRNLYRGAPPAQAILTRMAAYVRETAAVLDAQLVTDITLGRLRFAPLPDFT